MHTVSERIEQLKTVFKREHGELKYNKIVEKIQSNKKINSILNMPIARVQSPQLGDFIYAVYEIPFFLIRGQDSKIVGTVLFFEMWNNTCNTDKTVLGEDGLNNLLSKILERSNSDNLRFL